MRRPEAHGAPAGAPSLRPARGALVPSRASRCTRSRPGPPRQPPHRKLGVGPCSLGLARPPGPSSVGWDAGGYGSGHGRSLSLSFSRSSSALMASILQSSSGSCSATPVGGENRTGLPLVWGLELRPPGRRSGRQRALTAQKPRCPPPGLAAAGDGGLDAHRGGGPGSAGGCLHCRAWEPF